MATIYFYFNSFQLFWFIYFFFVILQRLYKFLWATREPPLPHTFINSASMRTSSRHYLQIFLPQAARKFLNLTKLILSYNVVFLFDINFQLIHPTNNARAYSAHTHLHGRHIYICKIIVNMHRHMYIWISVLLCAYETYV